MGNQSQQLRSGLNVFPELPSELCTRLLSGGPGWVLAGVVPWPLIQLLSPGAVGDDVLGHKRKEWDFFMHLFLLEEKERNSRFPDVSLLSRLISMGTSRKQLYFSPTAAFKHAFSISFPFLNSISHRNLSLLVTFSFMNGLMFRY